MALTEKYVSALAGGAGTGTIGSPYTLAQMATEINGGILGPGTRYNIKADGTYTISGDMDMGGTAGTNANPIVMRGYKTTIGDGYLGRTGGNGALITTNMPLINLGVFAFGSPQYSSMESLNFTGTRGDWMVKPNVRSAMIGCVANNTGTNTGSRAAQILEWCVVFECDFLLSSAGSTYCVMEVNAGGCKIDSCRVISLSSTADGIKSDWQADYYGCLIKGAGGGAGIHFSDGNRDCFIRSCTITGWQDGIKDDVVTNFPVWLCGNMITDNTGWGINFTAVGCPLIVGPNRTRDNVLGDCNNGTTNWLQVGRIIPLTTTDTGGPETDYVNAATNDFNLIAASPGKGANRPKIADMGAYGLPDPSGGGGAAVFNPFASFIIRPAAA